MTFIIGTARGSGGPSAPSGSAILYDDSYSATGGANASFQLTASGTVAGAVTSAQGHLSYSWLLSGSAADYEVYAQPTSGSFSSGVANAWRSLAATRIWTVQGGGTKNNPSPKSCTATFTIRNKTTLATVASAPITLTATVS